MRSLLPSGVALGILAAAVSATTTLAPASAGRPHQAARVTSVKVHRGGPDVTVTFHRSRSGEVFLNATVSARGVSWAEPKNESAVVSAYVDGHYATDIVITSAGPVARQFALGHVGVGRHTLRLHYATQRSPSDAGVATLQQIGFSTVRPSSAAYVAARYAPILYGRNLGHPLQNNRTDTPLIAWHEVLPAATSGHQILEYSVVWSNEDGGTDTPALMARWGRTTDIEWIYRVEVDAQGRRVAGTGVFQSANHGTTRFQGRYDGTHPLLQTCTTNNNVCDNVNDPMRFALSTRAVRPPDQPREHLMDRHPWTYPVMAQEMLREGKIESPSDPSTPAVGDQRTYLYIAVDHDTEPPASASIVGLAVDVQLKGDPTIYTSDHHVGGSTINRDDPAATTVELPADTTPADIASISVRRASLLPSNEATLTVTDIDRAFFLDPGYLPQASFLRWHGSVTLTATSPTAQLWPPTGRGPAGTAG